MKHIIILGDGMADEPIPELGDKTPMEVANTPTMDWLASHGRVGRLKTVPVGYHPGSEVANMSVLGYDLDKTFEGRGSLEAASIGVPLLEGEMAMRCNLICIENGIIKNHSAGHISNEEAAGLIDFLNEQLADDDIRFYQGVSYRHLLKVKHGDKRIHCTPPHDVPGTPFRDVLIRPEAADAQATADLLNGLILRSQELLENHPVNIKRKAEGKDAANSIWPWSPGYRPRMQTLMERFGVERGVVISAVDLIRGIGVYAGLKLTASPYVLVHDAARPYLDIADLKALKDTLQKEDAAILAVKAKDTIKTVRDGYIQKTLDRNNIYLAQTPQGAKSHILKAAYEKALNTDIPFTDEASILEYCGIAVKIVVGNYRNIKITYKEDLDDF